MKIFKDNFLPGTQRMRTIHRCWHNGRKRGHFWHPIAGVAAGVARNAFPLCDRPHIPPSKDIRHQRLGPNWGQSKSSDERASRPMLFAEYLCQLPGHTCVHQWGGQEDIGLINISKLNKLIFRSINCLSLSHQLRAVFYFKFHFSLPSSTPSSGPCSSTITEQQSSTNIPWTDPLDKYTIGYEQQKPLILFVFAQYPTFHPLHSLCDSPGWFFVGNF